MVFIKYQPKHDTIDISMNLIEQYNIVSQRIILKIGGFSCELAVNIDEELPEDTIGIPRISNELTIPEDIPYDLVINGRVLSLGPVIALVAYFKQSELSPKRLDRLKGRFSDYQTIKGLIFVCAARGINIEKKQIEGFYYNPNGKNSSTRWIYGVFPYPDVVYKRHPIDPVRYNDLLSQIGDKVINSYYFCKGELPEYASRNAILKELFPETENLAGFEQLKTMLRKHQTVYIKPPKGEGGRGIFNVTMDDQENYIFVNHNDKKTIINEQNDLNLFLEKFISRNYIIQQGVSTTIGESNVDFRVYMQKNGLKQWQCQGMIGRVAKKDKIITNLKFVEKLLSGIDAIKLLFGINHKDAVQIQAKIYDKCKQACMELDKCVGNYGDVAIDCIVDQYHNVWILEVNKRYGYDSLAKVKNYNLMRILFVTPFRYAKALAGF